MSRAKFDKVTDTFVVTDDHIKLIQKMYIGYDEYTEFGAPRVYPNHPYGSSDVLGDMCRILGRDTPDHDTDERYSDEEESYLTNLHRETAKALGILVQHLRLEPGKYEQHMHHKWVRAQQ